MDVLWATVYLLVQLAGGLAVLVGVRRHRPSAHAAWVLLGAGHLALFCGNVPTYLAPLVGMEKPPYPSPLTLIYVAQYPLTALGLLLLVRRRTPSWDIAGLIDAAIVTVSASLLSWIYLIDPLLSGAELGLAERTAAAAFPLGDLLLLALGARLMLGAGLRPPALRVLAAYLVLFTMADTGLSVATLSGRPALGWVWAEVLVTCASVALGVAGLHPSMRQVEDRSPTAGPDAGRRRLLLLTTASLLAPATLLVQYHRDAPLYVPLVCATCGVLYLLVLARMVGLVAAQREVAITDGLTGLHTRRYFEHSLAVEAERALRGAGLAVLLLDIDHFKSVNDTYGHHGGDRVLCEVARRLRATLRDGELIARYGGEEFAVLIPNTVPPIAREVAERVRSALSDTPMPVSPTRSAPVTVSIGVATMPEDADSGDELVRLADRLLYASKEAGRNRVTSTVNLHPAAPVVVASPVPAAAPQ